MIVYAGPWDLLKRFNESVLGHDPEVLLEP